MTPYHSVEAKLSNLQPNKLKTSTKKATHLTLRLSKHMSSTSETNFLHNLVGLPLMKNVLPPFAEGRLILLGLRAAALAADAGIYKNS